MFETETNRRSGACGGLGSHAVRLANALSAWLLRRLLGQIDIGQITICLPAGEVIVHTGARPGPKAKVTFHRWRGLWRLLSAGSVGFAEAYAVGDWSTPDLPELLDLLAQNLDRLSSRIGASAPVRAANRLRHALRANTPEGSRRNIAFHYDLGNDFYRTWLDADLIYSAALYKTAEDTLEAAQAAKIRRIIDWLRPRPEDEVLEIGCGWGALARELGRCGAHVTGLTLSSEQFAHATGLIARHDLHERVSIRLQDYRTATGAFDKIVSIEMMEAVGETYWPTYFGVLRDRLKPGGRAVLQVITIGERQYARYRNRPDFIQRHIFPGGMLPTKARIAAEAEGAGLALAAVEAFGLSYAETLKAWRKRFLQAWPKLESQGVSQHFRRMWEYYLCYCEAGFRSGALDVGLYVLNKRLDPGRPG